MPKLLLIEDNEMNRDMLQRRLQKRGYDVVVAVDGQQGIDVARRELPDLVLLDMSLPVLDGWSAAGILKGEAPTAAIPIVALTAHAMAGERERAMAAGCDEYETKPIDLQRLLTKIEALLPRK
jgi:two-component system cell cycle response regulator DivK